MELFDRTQSNVERSKKRNKPHRTYGIWLISYHQHQQAKFVSQTRFVIVLLYLPNKNLCNYYVSLNLKRGGQQPTPFKQTKLEGGRETADEWNDEEPDGTVSNKHLHSRKRGLILRAILTPFSLGYSRPGLCNGAG